MYWSFWFLKILPFTIYIEWMKFVRNNVTSLGLRNSHLGEVVIVLGFLSCPFPSELASFRKWFMCVPHVLKPVVIIDIRGIWDGSLFLSASSLGYLITLEQFKENKLWKIPFEKLLNDRYALSFSLISLVVFLMPYIFLGRVFLQLYLWSWARIYELPPLRSPSGFVIRDGGLCLVCFLIVNMCEFFLIKINA